MSPLAPIALFAYSRPEHTRRTVEALQANAMAQDSDLFVFSDAAKDPSVRSGVEAVRRYIGSITGFRTLTIVERERNMGLAASIIDGVTSLTDSHGSVIVVEDDLVTSPYFLQYMNEGLQMYRDDEQVISIHGYVYPVRTPLPESFFIRGADCWGWATWKRGWDLFEHDGRMLLQKLKEQRLDHAFDWDGTYGNIRMLERQIAGKVNSWAIRWHASAFLQGRLTLYPGTSLVRNIGGDAMATHTKSLTEFQTGLAGRPLLLERQPLQEYPAARQAFVDFFASIRQPIHRRILRWITSLFP
ncbi:MAG: glycosyltransferase family 2 protein [Bacteroidetes bacterium]|nr:glycosyltransferase family 2 protein [Bacteroidota bacterium]